MKRIIKYMGLVMVLQVCFVSMALLQAQKTYTLKQCVDISRANNANVQLDKLTAETNGVILKQSKDNVWPNLFANLNHGLNQGRSIDPFTNSYINQSVAYGGYSLEAAVVLFNGSQNKNTIQQNKLNYEASVLEAAQTSDNTTLNVIVAYLQILSNTDLLKQEQAQAAVTRQQVMRLAILDKEGAVAPAQYYDLKGQLANDELAIINSQNALDQARLSLAQLMNIPYDKDMEVEPLDKQPAIDIQQQSPAGIYAYAADNLPMLKAFDLRRQSALKGLKIAKGNFYPIISLGASLNTNYSSAARMDVFVNSAVVASGDYIKLNGTDLPVMTQRNNFNTQKIGYGSQFNNNYNTSVFLSVRVPIVNSFRARNQVAAAKISMKAAEVNATTANNQLNQLVEQAYFNLTAANSKVTTLERQVADFAESFRTVEVRFNAGVITQVDYLIAKNNLDRSNTNLIIAQYDLLFRSKILDYYKGSLAL